MISLTKDLLQLRKQYCYNTEELQKLHLKIDKITNTFALLVIFAMSWWFCPMSKTQKNLFKDSSTDKMMWINCLMKKVEPKSMEKWELEYVEVKTIFAIFGLCHDSDSKIEVIFFWRAHLEWKLVHAGSIEACSSGELSAKVLNMH